MFKPMLAVNTTVDKVTLPAYGSIKLEGVRGQFTPDGLLTRPMKTFGNPLIAEKFKALVDHCREENLYVEGEFYIHGMEFSDISSICRRRNHENTDKMEFHIFDIYDPSRPDAAFTIRKQAVLCMMAENNFPSVKVITQTLHFDHGSIARHYEDALEEGYEGYVLKGSYSSYKHGRATHREQKFLRIKQQNTYDGVVLDIIEMQENLCVSQENELGYLSKKQDKDMKRGKGMAAVAVVKANDFDTPIRVTLSRGLTDAGRTAIWDNREDYIGKHIRFVGIPVKGMLPRAPRFDDWRTDLD